MTDKTTKQEMAVRRGKVNNELTKHNYKAEDIANALEIEVTQVYKDLNYIRKSSRKWLDSWAMDGYTQATKTTIDQLERMENDLNEIIQNEEDMKLKLKAYSELRETINLRWVVQGEGPTLMNLRRFSPNEASK